MFTAQLLTKSEPNKYGFDLAITMLMIISRIFKLLDQEMVYREYRIITDIPDGKGGSLLIGYDLLVILNALRDSGNDFARLEMESTIAQTEWEGEEDWPWDEPDNIQRG